MRTKALCASLTAVVLGWGIQSSAHAGAVDVPQQGARASGQAEAFAAQADDASAIWHNPAGLGQLTGTNATAGGTLIFPTWTFNSAAGQEQTMQLQTMLPCYYLETDFGLQNWRFGLGLNNPFGLKEDWGNDGPLRAVEEHAHMYTLNLAPSVAYKFNDHLSVGVDLNVYWGELELAHSVISGSAGEGQFHFRGEDMAVGATPGILWKIDDRNTLAAVYRSPFTLSYSGHARVIGPGSADTGAANSTLDTPFPQMATLAYAMRPIRNLKLEADVVWTDWNVDQNLVLHSTSPAFNKTTIKDDWKSGFSFRFGTQYDLNQHWALRAGYAYGQNAVPNGTYSPLVPDSNYHLFSVGVGYSQANWSIDLAYQYILRETRHISNSLNSPIVDGTWNNNFNELMASLTIKL